MAELRIALAALVSFSLASACAAGPAPPGPEPGFLVPAPGSPFTIGGEPADLAVGDLDGDGHPDLVVAGDGGLAILLGGGRGGFGAPRRFPVAGPSPHLALGTNDGTVWAWLQRE